MNPDDALDAIAEATQCPDDNHDWYLAIDGPIPSNTPTLHWRCYNCPAQDTTHYCDTCEQHHPQNVDGRIHSGEHTYPTRPLPPTNDRTP